MRLIDVRDRTYPDYMTARLTPELREQIGRVAAEAQGNQARVEAIREIVRNAPAWEPRDPTREADGRISLPYRQVSDDEVTYGTGPHGSFGISRFHLVVSPVPGSGFSARLEASAKDLARGEGADEYAALIGLLRERCRAARDTVLADLEGGILRRSAGGRIESLEALADACSGDLGRYIGQAPVPRLGLQVDTEELATLVERDLDMWLRSGGVPRQRRSPHGPATSVTPDFGATAFVSAVDGYEVEGIAGLLAEDAASRRRAAARDGKPGFENVVEDIQAAGGDIHALLDVLRRHRAVVETIRGFRLRGDGASVLLSMKGSGFAEHLEVPLPHDETLAMIEGLARDAGQDPSTGASFSFRWKSPGPHGPGDVTGIRAMETSAKDLRYIAVSLFWAR